MSKISFKQFNSFVSQDELTEEQLDEIFGKFFGRDEKKLNDLQAKKLALQKAADAKKKEISAAKDAAFKAARDRVNGVSQKSNPLMDKPTSQMRAGALRAVDRNPFAFESVELKSELQKLSNRLTSGELNLSDILASRSYTLYASKAARDFLQNRYDEIASEKRLHPDDDFEKIEDYLLDELDKEFSA